MAVVVIQRIAGYTITVDDAINSLVTDDQAHDLQKALSAALRPPKAQGVTPAKARLTKP